MIRAIKSQADLGTLYGAPIEMEIDYARLINKYYPSMEMMRFVNSGTEATMHAIRLARGYTGRKKIIKVGGAFHGSHDAVLVKAGSGATTHSSPDSAGVPEEVTRNTLIVPYNDPEAILRAIRDNKGEVAAMILEPVIGNAGPILPKEGYLEQLREMATAEDVLLIFDEVITGFRLAMGGAQEYYGISRHGEQGRLRAGHAAERRLDDRPGHSRRPRSHGAPLGHDDDAEQRPTFPTGTDATYIALVDTFANSSSVLFGLTNEPGGNTLSNASIAAAMSHAVGSFAPRKTG